MQEAQVLSGDKLILTRYGGHVSFKAIAHDPNGGVAQLEWKLADIKKTLKDGTSEWAIDPSSLIVGNIYTLEVTAIDSSDSSLKTTIKRDIEVTDAQQEAPNEDQESAGSVSVFWLLSLLIFTCRHRRFFR